MSLGYQRPVVPALLPGEDLYEVFPHDIFEGLSEREKQAIFYYIQSGNKTAAYTAAGYKNNSETLHNGGAHPGQDTFQITDNKHATRFFAQRHIAEAVERAQATLTAKAGVTTEDILTGLKSDAYGDLGELYVPGTFQLKPPSEWPEQLRRSVQEIAVRTMPNGDIMAVVRWPDRIRAKELLGKHKRMWEEKQTQGHGSTLIIQHVVQPPPALEPKPVRQAVIDAGSFQIVRPPLVVDAPTEQDSL